MIEIKMDRRIPEGVVVFVNPDNPPGKRLQVIITNVEIGHALERTSASPLLQQMPERQGTGPDVPHVP
jgi:hypothetical protein